MQAAHHRLLKDAQADLHRVPEWSELTQEEHGNCLSELDNLKQDATSDLTGIQKLVNAQFVISEKAADLKRHIQELGTRRKRERHEEEKAKAKKGGKTKLERSVSVPGTITSTDKLTEVIRQLEEVREAAAGYGEISVTVKVE